MSIPVIDMGNPDISQLAQEVKAACSVVYLLPSQFSFVDMGVHVPQEPRNSKFRS